MIRRFLKSLFTWALALLILFEEWGWEPLGRLLARLGRLPFFASVELRIRSLPPYASLTAFALPFLALLPVKVLALWLIARGHPLQGLVFILFAKLAGTALMARLFTLTQPALMRIAWFARYYGRWTAWKDALLARVRASPAWVAIGRAKAALRALGARIKSNFT
jgi:hypothetical protein